MKTWRCRMCRLPAEYGQRLCSLCEQDGLFEAPRAGDYRTNDPVTSKHAAARNLSGRMTQRKKILVRMLDGPVTSHDVADLTAGQNGTASKRLGELERDGLIERCEIVDHRRFLYRLTDDGTRDAHLMAVAS